MFNRYRKPPLGTKVNTSDPLSFGLAAAYLFNENSGSRLIDIYQNNAGTQGTLHNVSWSTSITGSAWIGNGSSTYIDIGLTSKPASLNLSGAMTAFAIVKPSSTASRMYICSDNDSISNNFQWSLIVNTGGTLQSIWGNHVVLSSTGTIAANAYSSIGITRAGSGSSWTYAFYINGLVSGSGTTTMAPGTQQGASIGVAGNALTGYYNGLLDCLYIYIKEHYQQVKCLVYINNLLDLCIKQIQM